MLPFLWSLCFSLSGAWRSTALNAVASRLKVGFVKTGGGDKGAFEVGVLKEFLKKLPAEETAYDVVTGVSVGALNAIHFAYTEKG